MVWVPEVLVEPIACGGSTLPHSPHHWLWPRWCCLGSGPRAQTFQLRYSFDKSDTKTQTSPLPHRSRPSRNLIAPCSRTDIPNFIFR